ncbi:M48 family metallopeptidase [bacterium]|nr:M48 family metallopeptidase [bacterium]
MHFEGRYYDGASARSLPVVVIFHRDGDVRIEGEGLALRFRIDELLVTPRLGRTPRILSFPNGASCELPDDGALDRELAGGSTGFAAWVAVLERSWRAVVVAVVLTAVFLGAAIQLGVPALARAVALSFPSDLCRELGERSLGALDEALFRKSALSAGPRASATELFASLAGRRRIDPEPSLVFRNGGALGANAFALPSGIVVATDQLVELAASDAELAAVLAHELGHVEHRHALRSVLQNVGVVVLVSAAFGDIASSTSFAAALPALMVELSYSRRFENEADAYAVALLEEAGIPREALAKILERLEEQSGGGIPVYLSTHPATAERARAIREGRAS